MNQVTPAHVIVGALLMLAAMALLVFGPALIDKARYAMRGQSSRIVLNGWLHAAHLDTDVYPNRETRRAMSPGLGRRLWVMRQADQTGAVTLAQAKLNAPDDLDVNVIDEFRKSSFILDNITFDDVVTPQGGGSLTFTYTRLATQPTAQVRAINSEYVPQEVTKVRDSAECKPFGGAFEIDRVLAEIGAVSEVTLQMEQKIKAARTLFHDLAINGDPGTNANEFAGLDSMLTGTTTEFRPTTVTDWSNITTQAQAQLAVRDVNAWLSKLDAKPAVLAGGSEIINLLKFIATVAGYTLGNTEDAFGRQVETFNGIPMVDLGEKPGSNVPVVPTENRTVGGNPFTNLTDLYAWRFGLDGFHAISPAGLPLVRTWLPDFSTAGAVKRGEVELVAAVVLKATKAAGVFRNIKVLA